MRAWCKYLLGILIAVLVGAATIAVRAGTAGGDEQYLEGLRTRRLYELAEKYCQQRLEISELDEQARGDLVIEFSRTLAEHALHAEAGKAADLWRRAVGVTAEFADKYPQSPRLVLVSLQGALVQLAEGEVLRQGTLEAYDSNENARARERLREALRALDRVAEEIGRQLRQANRAPAGEQALTTAELQSLELHVQCERARALRNQALSYPPASADRINSLTRAGEALGELQRHQARTMLYWSAALEQLARLRLLGDFAAAERLLNELAAERPAALVVQRLRAERIRLALARGRIDDALAEAGTAGDRTPVAVLDYARLEALLAAWRRAVERKHPEEATQWQQRSVAQAQQFAELFGGHWSRRAESLVAAALAHSDSPQTAAALVFTAAGYYRSGQMDKALATFDEAARQFRAAQQAEQAFEAAYSAASIEKQREHYRQALDRYRQLALAAPQLPKAAAAHLQAAYCAAQVAQATTPPELKEYQQLLEEHVRTWPSGETTSQAHSWLGRLAEHRRDWLAALTHLKLVKPGDAQYLDAVEAIGRCYQAQLAELYARGEDGRELANEALAALEPPAPDGRTKPGPAQLDPAARSAALAAARIWLTEFPTGGLPAERLLRDALAGDVAGNAPWQVEARRWLVPALALQGKGGQADQVIDQLPATGPEILALLDVLTTVRRRQSSENHQRLARIELAAQDRFLKRQRELDGDSLRGLQRHRAVTLAETGDRPQGLAALEELAREFPRDGQTQEELARLLAEGTGEELRAALTRWTEVARKSRPGTARWFRAHEGLARVQLRLDDAAAARATLEGVRSRFPELGGPEMKPRFERLIAAAAR